VNEDQPYLQIPVFNVDDRRAYEEWLKKQKDEKKDDEKVVIIDL
jgi:hypothetical protein